VYQRLYEDGVCIVEDFFEDPTDTGSANDESYPKALFKCSQAQATWITKANRSRDIIYDGVKRSSVSAGYDTIHGESDPKSKQNAIKGPCMRQQLKPCKANEEEMQKYHFQMKEILLHIFDAHESPRRKDPQNWKCKMTNLVGGNEYQHAHADQGWGMEFEGENTFPFVATHGFGMYPGEIWLLPKGKHGKNDYGFLHTLPPTALLLMRGDFIHAGGASWFPRCHMKFYPTVNAGTVKGHSHHYWLDPDFQCDLDEERFKDSQVESSFLWQHYTFPFAYPTSTWVHNKKNGVYEEILRYHTDITLGLLDDTKEGRKQARESISERGRGRPEEESSTRHH
jgi:hypothetical protein